MATSNLIAHDLRRHQTRIFRVSANLVDYVTGRLTKLGKRLVDELLSADPTEPRTYSGQQRRLAGLKSDAQQFTRRQFAQIKQRVLDEAVGISDHDAEVVAEIITRHAAKDQIPDIGIPALTNKARRTAAERALIEGAPSSEWWARQSEQITRDFVDRVNLGMRRGEPITTIARSLRPTLAREAGETDQGLLLRKWQRNAEALVRSSVLAVNNAVRLEEFRQSDVVPAAQILVTFDQRTCVICRGFSGAAFNLATGNPLPESPYRGKMPVLPAHWACRCLWVPLLQDEKPAEDYYYEDWLKQQDVAEQRDILGPGRYDLWKKGSVSLTDMIDQRGNPMTLEQLRQEAA